MFHCHGDYSVQNPDGSVSRSDRAHDQFNSDNFSQTDLNTAQARANASGNPAGYKSYLGTPSGNSRQDQPNSPAGTPRNRNF